MNRLAALLPALAALASAQEAQRHAGSAACADCHSKEASSYRHARMANSLSPAAASRVLAENPLLEWSDGEYSYRIQRDGGRVRYTVSSGAQSLSHDLLYAFGNAKAGQTFIYSDGGFFHETRVSWYTRLKGLDLTTGAANAVPSGIHQAAGHKMSPADAAGCFGCHTTGAVSGAALQLEKFEPGLQCEGCHGPGSDHIAAIRAARVRQHGMKKLSTLDAEAVNEFCGRCHRTWEQVMTLGLRGTNTVKFAPYRLTNSKCYDAGDRRISCVACHNPHEPLNENAASYDAKCNACHASGAPARKTCPTPRAGCVTCHMPRVEPPGSHHAFFDHWIRIARPGDPYPE